ncbi:MAG TPA: DUF1122 family protein [Dehalococcoidia bacterium]|nr:DUF1122 family protein [Dehalococcoidia bacterium]
MTSSGTSNGTSDGSPDPRWRRLGELPAHPAARWDGAAVGVDISIEAWLGPSNAVGAHYFRLFLESKELGHSNDALLLGIVNTGPVAGHNWVEVIDYREVLPMDSGQEVTVPESVERVVFGHLAQLVPVGGHLMVEYDSSARSMTARALAAGAPPRATPLGETLAATGCGVAIRDWYTSEGGREGRRKLQGFRAVDGDHQHQRDRETLVALRQFFDNSAHLEWDLQSKTRGIAEQAITELETRLGPLAAQA